MSEPPLRLLDVPGTNGRRLSIQVPDQTESTLSSQVELVPGAKVDPAGTITTQILLFNKTGQDYERSGFSNYNNEVVIFSDARGTGRARPMIFYVGGQTLIDLRAVGGVGRIGFFGQRATERPTVTGSHCDGTALASLIGALAALGLITDETTPHGAA